jgi:glucokinase
MSFGAGETVIMTLDAGGTSLRFSALRAGAPVTPVVTMPSQGHDLGLCLATIVKGFEEIRAVCPARPAAISFAFPAPADYPRGIIGDLYNLPGFRGGIALGPMLEERFQVPVFINNDGDLFAYGEASSGFLPYVNGLLEAAGSPKRYRNLLGVTLGTGFGGGIVRNGELFLGDNSMAGEIWQLRHKLDPRVNVEEGASIRAVRRVYAEEAGIPLAQAPDPRVIAQIAAGESPGSRAAAQEAYRRLGEVVGDALATALALVDGLVVVGGGLSNAHRLFLPEVVRELNSTYRPPGGAERRRLETEVFNLEEPEELARFVAGNACEVTVPLGTARIRYDRLSRLGVGVSRLGTSQAIALGAYAFALRALSQGGGQT